MLREIIKIDRDLCTGCGDCIPGCPEGALQIIDGKAVLVSDLMCDGLGACIGHCPEGAIQIEKREAEPYSEEKVIIEILKHGRNTVAAHLKHLREHGEIDYLNTALNYLEANSSTLGFDLDSVIDEIIAEINQGHQCGCGGHQAEEHHHGGGGCCGGEEKHEHHHGGGGHHGCPGSKEMTLDRNNSTSENINISSELGQWPVQMHLISPQAQYFQNADLLFTADCVPFAMANFHQNYLKGKSLAIACPKLDDGTEIYIEKLVALIDVAKINTITIMMMEVPCCGGMLNFVQLAQQKATRKVPIKVVYVGVKGDILSEEWI